MDASDNLDKPCYDYKGLSRSRLFLERLTEALQPVGFDIYQIDHEDANGQFEINYTYSDAMESADRFTFFRMAAGEIANDLGMICSFMPKPDPKRAGNGMHFHLSLASSTHKNLFHDPSDSSGMGLSKLAYHFAAADGTRPGAVCLCGADGQFLQASGGGPVVVGLHLGPGLRCLGGQQPFGDGTHSLWSPGVSPAGRRLQPVPGHRRDHCCRPGWH